MKIDFDAYTEIVDRVRMNLVRIKGRVVDGFIDYDEIDEYISNIESLLQEINEGKNGWEIRSAEDSFDE